MEACHRSELDQAVNIRELERYVADHAKRKVLAVLLNRGPVAVVGSGPGGLSAAYHLARLGYQVTVFESGPELGGVMRTGIPPYRLPREVLDHEVEFILSHGVKAELCRRITKTDLLAVSREFKAVFVATGLQEYRDLNLGDVDRSVIMQGVPFLESFRAGAGSRLDGQKVIVIGGGNTAIDAARTALRLGATVQIVYRRTRMEMPAIAEEIEEAIEEGVQLTELLAPSCLTASNAHWKLSCRRMQLGEPDESGRRAPFPVPGSAGELCLDCDKIILALGQTPDLSILPEGSEIREDGAFIGLTGAPIFSGGDLQTNEGTVAAAIGSGRKAAWHIHEALSGESLFPAQKDIVPASGIRFNAFPHKPRQEARLRDPEERRNDFDEVRLGLEESPQHWEAWEESQRCFSCGICTNCDICRANCPEGILERRGDEYSFNYDYCKGCGLCAFECPRGVIVMQQL